jgi:hypothetical protein
MFIGYLEGEAHTREKDKIIEWQDRKFLRYRKLSRVYVGLLIL